MTTILAPKPRFWTLPRLVRAAQVVLPLAAIVGVFFAVLDLHAYDLAVAGAARGVAESAARKLVAAVQLASGFVVLATLYRARMQLTAVDSAPRLRFAPGWAIGCWFVPVVNLVLPVLVVAEIDAASEAAASGRAVRSRYGLIGAAVGAWGLSLVTAIVTRVIAGSLLAPATTRGITVARLASVERPVVVGLCVVAGTASVAAAALAIPIIRRIARNQAAL